MNTQTLVGYVGYWSPEDKTILDGFLKIDGLKLILIVEEHELVLNDQKPLIVTLGDRYYSDKHSVRIGNENFYMTKPQYNMVENHFAYYSNHVDEEESNKGNLEKRYLEDNKLEHTRLDFILCYIDEVKKYLKGNMELFGHSYLVKTFNDKGEEWYSIKGNSQCEEIEYKIFEIKDNLISMEISNLKIKVLLSDYKKLKIFLEKINQEPNNKKKQKATIILDRVSNLMADEKLIEMLNNFIDEIPAELFLNPQLIAQVEALIAFKFGRLDYLLISDEILRAKYCSIEEEIVGNQVTTTINFDNEGTILSYFSNGLTFICDLIEEHTGLEENNVAYISYSLLNKVAYKRYSLEWQEEYGFEFDNVKNLNLDELLEVYINLDSIDPSNIITAGKFINYLMKWCKFANNNNYCLCFDEFVSLYSIAEQQKKKIIFRKKYHLIRRKLER